MYVASKSFSSPPRQIISVLLGFDLPCNTLTNTHAHTHTRTHTHTYTIYFLHQAQHTVMAITGFKWYRFFHNLRSAHLTLSPSQTLYPSLTLSLSLTFYLTLSLSLSVCKTTPTLSRWQAIWERRHLCTHSQSVSVYVCMRASLCSVCVHAWVCVSECVCVREHVSGMERES